MDPASPPVPTPPAPSPAIPVRPAPVAPGPLAPAGTNKLFVGKTVSLPIKIYDQDKVSMDVVPGHVVWTSSAPAIARVDSAGDGSGNVTGVSEGKAEISASVNGARSIAAPPVVFNVVNQVPTKAEIVVPKPDKPAA